MPHKHLPSATNNHNKVRVLMPLQCGMTALPDLEVAQLYGQIMTAIEEPLAGHVLKDCAVFLVRQDVHAVPPKAAVVLPNHSYLYSVGNGFLLKPNWCQ